MMERVHRSSSPIWILTGRAASGGWLRLRRTEHPGGSDLAGAQITGMDYWGVAYGYGQAMCEKNAESEGVGFRCAFRHGDANKLDFPDESFDAVVSNYVYHNVMGADKQALLLETLRVLKKGGVFALNDEMKPHMYGNMEAFAQELRDMGYADVRLIDTAQEAFGSRRRAAMMMLGDSRMLVGRK